MHNKLTFLKATLLFLLVPITIRSQTWQWANGINGYGWGYSVAKDTANNYFVAGEVSNYTVTFGTVSLTTGGAYLAKYNQNGNILWAQGTSTYYVSRGFSVSTDKTGNAYLTGLYAGLTAFGTKTLNSTGYSDAYVTKYDNNGNVVWAKSFGSTSEDMGSTLDADSAGTIIFAGTFRGSTISFSPFSVSNPNPGADAAFLAKLNSNGNVIWAKRPFVTGEGSISSLAQDNIGNIYVTGILNSSVTTIGSYTLTGGSGVDAFIAKFDANGDAVWAQKYNKAGGQSIDIDASGNIYVTGSFWDTTMAVGSYTLSNAVSYDYFLLKLDSNGSVIWAREGLSADNAYGNCVCADENNVFVSGNFYTSLLLDTFSFSASAGSMKPSFIAKYDPSGNVVCAHTLSKGSTADLVVDEMGGTIMAGSYDTGTLTIGTYTLNTSKQFSPFVAKYFCSNEVGTHDLSENIKFELYPNPVKESLYLKNPTYSNSLKILIYSPLGQKILDNKLQYGENKITIEQSVPGIYFYFIVDNNEYIGGGKLVVE